MVADRIAELEQCIALKCIHCHKLKSSTHGMFECGRRQSQCHLRTVRRWLKEIDELRSSSA